MRHATRVFATLTVCTLLVMAFLPPKDPAPGSYDPGTTAHTAPWVWWTGVGLVIFFLLATLVCHVISRENRD